MRPVLVGDLIAVARVLLTRPEVKWAEIVATMIDQAKQAETYRVMYRHAHAQWGDGSLMSLAAGSQMAREPFLDDVRYLRALSCVLDGLLAEKLSFVYDEIDLYKLTLESCGAYGDGGDESEVRGG